MILKHRQPRRQQRTSPRQLNGCQFAFCHRRINTHTRRVCARLSGVCCTNNPRPHCSHACRTNRLVIIIIAVRLCINSHAPRVHFARMAQQNAHTHAHTHTRRRRSCQRRRLARRIQCIALRSLAEGCNCEWLVCVPMSTGLRAYVH